MLLHQLPHPGLPDTVATPALIQFGSWSVSTRSTQNNGAMHTNSLMLNAPESNAFDSGAEALDGSEVEGCEPGAIIRALNRLGKLDRMRPLEILRARQGIRDGIRHPLCDP
jgi:hypothetical protein